MPTQVVRFEPGRVIVSPLPAVPESHEYGIDVDDVVLQIGYEQDPGIFTLAGIPLVGEQSGPQHDPTTMESAVPGSSWSAPPPRYPGAIRRVHREQSSACRPGRRRPRRPSRPGAGDRPAAAGRARNRLRSRLPLDATELVAPGPPTDALTQTPVPDHPHPSELQVFVSQGSASRSVSKLADKGLQAGGGRRAGRKRAGAHAGRLRTRSGPYARSASASPRTPPPAGPCRPWCAPTTPATAHPAQGVEDAAVDAPEPAQLGGPEVGPLVVAVVAHGRGRPGHRALDAEADRVRGRSYSTMIASIAAIASSLMTSAVSSAACVHLVHRDRGRHRQRVAVVGAEVPHTAVGDRGHDVGAPAEGGQREAAADALASVTRSGCTPGVGRPAVAGGQAGLDLVEDEQHAVLVAQLAHRGGVPASGSTMPRFSSTGSITSAATSSECSDSTCSSRSKLL